MTDTRTRYNHRCIHSDAVRVQYAQPSISASACRVRATHPQCGWLREVGRNRPEIFRSLRLERSAGAPPLTATAAHSLLAWARSANVQQHVQTLVVTKSFMEGPSDQVMSDEVECDYESCSSDRKWAETLQPFSCFHAPPCITVLSAASDYHVAPGNSCRAWLVHQPCRSPEPVQSDCWYSRWAYGESDDLVNLQYPKLRMYIYIYIYTYVIIYLYKHIQTHRYCIM